MNAGADEQSARRRARAAAGRRRRAREITKYAHDAHRGGRARGACRAGRTTRRRCRRRARGRRSRRPSPTARARDGARRVRTQTKPTSMHGREVLDEQRDGHRHPLHRGEEEELAAGDGGEAERRGCSRQWRAEERRAAAGSRGTARATRMSPATPIRTRSAAPSDQPASSSGLMNGPLDENASADATAMTSPDVLHPRRGDRPDHGERCGRRGHGGIRLSGVKCAYTGDSIEADVRSQHGVHP